MTVNELDSRVAVVRRCFSERGDSILTSFVSLASQLIRSHDQPGSACAHIQLAAPRAPALKVITTEDPTSCMQHNPRLG